MIRIHPLVLSIDGLATLPAAADALFANCDLWWESKGVIVDHSPLKSYQFDVISSEENPWYRVKNWLGSHGFSMTSEDVYLVFLSGWNHPAYGGWGGKPLAVVGDTTLRFLYSVGSPEALVDDTLAGYIVCHEIGHTFGLPHDFNTQNSVMGYGWPSGYNFILGDLWDRLDAYRAAPISTPDACVLGVNFGSPHN